MFFCFLHILGVHLSSQDFHNKQVHPDTVVIDVRNFNETLIGKFSVPTSCTSTSDAERLDFNHINKKVKHSDQNDRDNHNDGDVADFKQNNNNDDHKQHQQ